MAAALPHDLADTIVARATAPGAAAIAVVRLSGPRSLALADRMAPGSRGRPPRQLCRGPLLDAAGAPLDDALVARFPGPGSYTGEDLVEFHLHGAPAVVQGALQACLDLGARAAAPGEFTERAFVRGRLDLAQAEAVGDLVAAASRGSAAAALRQLAGGLSQPVAALQRRLTALLSRWMAALDFPDDVGDDGIGPADAADVAALRADLEALCGRARLRPQGPARVVLAGPPNAGKSTLLNAWAGEERALVDAAAGTTRDAVEVALVDGGRPWAAVDTAGLRLGAQGLEARGVARARACIEQAAVVLWLQPADAPLGASLADCLGGAGAALLAAPRRLLVAASRADLASAASAARLEALCAAAGVRWGGAVSALHGVGCAALRATALAALDAAAGADDATALFVRQRHLELLQRAREALREASAALAAATPLDLVADTLRAALRPLGEVLGEDVEAPVLDAVFREFCIGK